MVDIKYHVCHFIFIQSHIGGYFFIANIKYHVVILL